MGMEGNFFSTMTAKLPMGGQGLGWLVPAVVAAVVALAVSGMSKKK
jgi:branched-subunit amino acid permease